MNDPARELESWLERLLRENPALKKPLVWVCALLATTLLGAAIVVIVVGIEDHKRTNTVAKVTANIVDDHNASACSLRVLVGGLRTRAVNSKDDELTPAALDRAEKAILSYEFILRGQITEPRDLNCSVLLARLAKEKKVPGVSKPSP